MTFFSISFYYALIGARQGVIMGRVLVFLLAMAGVSGALAQDVQSVQVDERKEAEIAQRAKKRLYPGGRDEADLKVQPQLTSPVRKLAPQADLAETVEE